MLVYDEIAQPAAMIAAATSCSTGPARICDSGEIARTMPSRLATPRMTTMPTTMPSVSTITWNTRAPAVT